MSPMLPMCDVEWFTKMKTFETLNLFLKQEEKKKSSQFTFL